VAFLRDAECSDGMSDVKHPVVARVSRFPTVGSWSDAAES
jgi:hypothetical protein